MSNCLIKSISKKDIICFICLFLSVIVIMNREEAIDMYVSSNYPSLIVYNCFFLWLFKKNLVIQKINDFIITRKKYNLFMRQMFLSNVCLGIVFSLVFTIFILIYSTGIQSDTINILIYYMVVYTLVIGIGSLIISLQSMISKNMLCLFVPIVIQLVFHYYFASVYFV